MALQRFRSRRLQLLVRVNRRRKAQCARGGRKGLLQLRGLTEEDRRRYLIEALQASLAGGDDKEALDSSWRMPKICKNARTANAGPSLKYDFRTCSVQLSADATSQLIRSCRVRYSHGGSSWMPCGATPQCLPELLAATIFTHHSEGASFDPSRSGAEWWAQLRQDGNPKNAIKFHWDADEFAVEKHGINIHPHLSTVTYLTDSGAPTLIVDCRNPLRMHDDATPCASIRQGLLSFPHRHKHIVFDGQFLHGNVPGMGPEGERVTFLVNVWLNHRPSNCHRLPSSIGHYLGSPNVPAALTPLVRPTKSIRDPSDKEFQSKFAWRSRLFCLRVPLPSNCDTAVLEWTHSAELSDGIPKAKSRA